MIVLADCELPKKTRDELAALLSERIRLKAREDKLSEEKDGLHRRIVRKLDKLKESSVRNQTHTLSIERGSRGSVKAKLLKGLGVKQSTIDQATVKTPYERVSLTALRR
jgi:hypothetical protein